MEKIKVAVLFGGQSTEHAVSLQSACAVLHAMKGTRFEAVPVGITREGRWFWYRGPLDAVGEGVWEKEECAPVTLTPDASVHGLLVQGAGSPVSGCGVSRAAWKKRRGRHRAGAACAGGHPLRGLRRAGKRPVYG